MTVRSAVPPLPFRSWNASLAIVLLAASCPPLALAELKFTTPYVPLVASQAVRNVVVADFDRDGYSDLAWPDSYGHAFRIAFGSSSGLYQRHGDADLRTDQPLHLGTADLNGDSWPDLFATTFTPNGVVVSYGTGGGNFGTPLDLVVNGAWDVTSGDLNHDGWPDLIVSNDDRGTLSVLLATGPYGFGAAQTFATGSTYSRALVVADFNQDGDLDA